MSPEVLSVPGIIKSRYGISNQILKSFYYKKNLFNCNLHLFFWGGANWGGGGVMIISALSNNYLYHGIEL